MNKILWFILVASVLFSGRMAWERIEVERANRRVEIVLDRDGFLDLCRRDGIPHDPTLKTFRSLGVTSIALNQSTLGKFHDEGKLMVISGVDLPLYKTNPRVAPIYNQISNEKFPYFVVLTRDEELKEWIEESLSALLSPQQIRPVKGGFLVDGAWDDLNDLGLGIYPKEALALARLGFVIDPRISNPDESDWRRTQYLLQNIGSLPKVGTVIFSGPKNEVLGYDENISGVARFLSKHGIRFGDVEAYESSRVLKGSVELANQLPGLVIKAQSLNSLPGQRTDVDRSVDMFTLGVRERNVRIIYFRPFLMNEAGKSLLATNREFLERLGRELGEDGFSFGTADPLRFSPAGRFGVLFLAFGVFSATLLLIRTFVWVPAFAAVLAFLIGGLLVLAGERFLGAQLPRSVLALWAGVIFPIYGFVLFSSGFPMRPLQSLRSLVKLTLVTICGGFVISALLVNDLTALGIEGFRGVKLLLLAPVVFAPWIAWLYHTKPQGELTARHFWSKFIEPLKTPLQISHVAILSGVAAIGLFMILRSGNAAPEGSVPGWERTFRSFLETVFVARPRFKEFLIGHPFYIAGCAVGFERSWALPLFILGALGQADILDSFAHLHTPILITLLRTFHGVWIGFLLGLVLRWIVLRIAKGMSNGNAA